MYAFTLAAIVFILVVVVCQAFNPYTGVAVGEHLGCLFTGAWTVFVGLAKLKSPLFKAWLGWRVIAPAIGIFVGLPEPLGLGMASAINAIRL